MAVESHQGSIWVEDNKEAGKGSVFCLALPLSRPQPDKRLTATATEEAPTPPTVMPTLERIDDDPLKTRTDFSVAEVKKRRDQMKAKPPKPDTQPDVENVDPPGTEPMISREEFRKRAEEAEKAENSDKPAADDAPAKNP